MKKTLYIIPIIIATACQHDIILPQEGPEVVPCLNARISTADTRHEILLDYSYFYGTAPANDASVFMSLNGNTLEASLDSYEPGRYTLEATVSPGDDIEIEAQTPYGKVCSKTIVPEAPRVKNVKVEDWSLQEKNLRLSLDFADGADSGYCLVETYMHHTAIQENTGESIVDVTRDMGFMAVSPQRIQRDGGHVRIVYSKDDLPPGITLDYNAGLPHSMSSHYQYYGPDGLAFAEVFYSRKVSIIVKVSAISREDFVMVNTAGYNGVELDFGRDESMWYPMNVDGGLGLVCSRSAIVLEVPFMEQRHYSTDNYNNADTYFWVWR